MIEDPSSLLKLRCPVCEAPAQGVLDCPSCGTALFDGRIGSVVAGGRYRVDRLLGQGGIGRVYRGTDLAAEGEAAVAIKFLLEKWLASKEQVERFRREALALERLRHDGIVRLLALGDEAGVPFLVMERLRGRTLAQVIGDGPLTPRRIVEVLGQALSAVDAAHGAGIVHRDLKPENIMLLDGPAAGAPRVKVLDFGIALFDDPTAPRLTQVGDVRGTPVYMSPEQCRGRAVGPPSDVYSLGVVLYELLAGKTPFAGGTTIAVVEAHAHRPPPRFSERAPGRRVPEALAAVAFEALAKAPEHRPSAYRMRASLMTALASLGEVADLPLADEAPAAAARRETLATQPDAPPSSMIADGETPRPEGGGAFQRLLRRLGRKS